MSATYPHLPEATAKLVDLPVIERVGYVLTDRYVYHEQATDLIRHVDFMVNKPRGVRPTGMVLASPSNSGKTAFAEAVVRRYTSRVATDQLPASRPTVMISMSGAHQANEIYSRFLSALGTPQVSSMTGRHRRHLALELGKASDLRLLIVDEIQDVLLSTPRQQELALLATKDLMNSLKVPVLALGTEDARHSLEADQHLKRRFQFRELPAWRADEYLCHFLEAYESTLPLKKRSGLGSHNIMKVLVKETEGLMGEIVERLRNAAAIAIESGIERITVDLIKRARYEVPVTGISENRTEWRAGTEEVA